MKTTLPFLAGWTQLYIIVSLTPSFILGRAGGGGGMQEIPHFIIEPPSTLTFVNSTGATLNCVVRQTRVLTHVSWVVGETGLTPVTNVAGVRELLANGSLVFHPFSPNNYRQDVHFASYRCLATSSIGALVSRTVTIRAVFQQDYEVRVYDTEVISGNTAVLKCHIAPYVQEYVKVTEWIQDNSLVIKPGLESGGKHMILHDGSLHIYRADPSDGYRSYKCKTNHTVTGEVRESSSGRVIIKEPHGDSPPMLTVSKKIQLTVRAGEGVILPCAAEAHPTPSYSWIRAGGNSMNSAVVGSSPRFSQVGGLLLISSVGVGDQGRFICNINNTMGRDFVEIALRVTEPLSVHIVPNRLLVDMGRSATFKCMVQGHPVTSLTWLRNGLPLPPDPRIISSPRETLKISQVAKNDNGIYQCVTSARHHTAQASAFLALGDSSPELHHRFQQQTLQPGPSVSLKCVATGNPPPQFLWTLDGFPLPESDRYLVGQYVTVHDDVISHVNITNARVEDGGVYTCTASNSVGKVAHFASVNIYGLPFIRPMGRVSAVSGSELRVKCPVAGYPIESITWQKDGRELPVSIHQRVFSNGTLVIQETQRGADEGRYTCRAVNRLGQSATRDVTITVTVPPKIMPFAFANKVLSEGNRASITCQILEGDLPLTFRWEKDAGNVPVYDGVTTRLLDDYSSQLVIERISSRHNGDYTCLVSNGAALRSFTATLTVNVPPHWITEPQDTSVRQGSHVSLNCQAEGFPVPDITWQKSSIKGSIGRYEQIKRDPNVIFSTNGSLTFRNVEKSTEGNYLCQAKNGISSGLSKVINLTVNSPAHFPEKMSRVVTRFGDLTELRCSAIGDKPIDILWYVDSRRLDQHSDRRMKIRKTPTTDGLVSTLTITRAIRGHTGTYTCNAANAFGRDSRIIELVVQEEPESPRNLRVVETHSRRILLSWSAPYAGNTPIQNYIIHYKLASEPWPSIPEQLSIPGDQTNAAIKELSPASAYHLRVTAQNSLGLGSASEVIQATTEEEEPSGAPQEVRISPESSTSLRVTWEPPGREHWNGNILGYYLGHRPYALATDYNFQTVEVSSQYGGSSTLSGLEKYTRYEVVVQAFNNRGAGPLSPPAIATTLEDAPSSPPETIRCESPSPESISVAWRPPPVSGQNGLIKGYRVLYRKSSDYPGGDPSSKVTAAESTNLFNLNKYTNYSITVLAFTTAGDGVSSTPIHCKTLQDVPGSPAAVKAVLSTPESILVTWLPPIHSNGDLTKYTLYGSIISQSQKRQLTPRDLAPDESSYLVEGVNIKDTCQFWVTASTPPGEGPPSSKINIKPKKYVAAQIASFGVPLEVPWKEDIRLLCHSLGDPQPRTRWYQHGQQVTSGDRIQILPNGSLFIRDIQKADAGNLTCTANNTHGMDSIIYTLTVQVPPAPPSLFVQGSSRASLSLRWTLRPPHAPVRGFIINYKRDFGDWQEVQLHSPRTTNTLSELVCGSRYQLYVTAYNEVGTGLPSEILTASTKGAKPLPPTLSRLLDVNSTSVMVHLSTFNDGGCPITSYAVDYKPYGARDWISASNNIAATEKTWIIRELRPSNRYTVKVTAHNQAGTKAAMFNVKTLSQSGVYIGSTTDHAESAVKSPPFLQDLRFLIPMLVVVILLISSLTAGVIIYFIRRRRSGKGKHIGDLGESPSTTQIQNDQNLQQSQQYSALAPNSPSTQDTNTYKADSADYVEDICPYATFQLTAPPKNQYGETTDSGIVYSGPYLPVQGAFVYHEPKIASVESFPLRQKEPQYMKVRRKGRRDPHQESTGKVRRLLQEESDNLGSTDSEVKKILSLHMPISEYDTLGSDSEGAGANDSPPTFAESAGLSHALAHHQGGRTRQDPAAHGRGSTDIFKHRSRSRPAEGSKSQEGSSSSSDSSSSGRRAHHRRGKKVINKRSSRVGTRTPFEETSFSYPHGEGKRRDDTKDDKGRGIMVNKSSGVPSRAGGKSGLGGNKRTNGTPIVDDRGNNAPPPPPPPRGFSDPRLMESGNPGPHGSRRGPQLQKGPPQPVPPGQQQKYYKKGARPRDSSYQINV